MGEASRMARLERRVQELSHALDLFQQCQEAEYRSLALDVRDELGQTLSTVLERLREMQDMQMEQAARTALGEIGSMCVDAIEEVNRLARILRPTVLDAKGLIPAIEWFCEATEAQTGIRIAFRHTQHELHFSKNEELLIYRILREAFANTYQHTKATLICVDMDYRDGQFTLTVSDNGCGFTAGDCAEGLGIVGMRERAMILGGTLQIASQPGRGTKVTLSCPLEQTPHDSGDYMEPFFRAGAQILESAKKPSGVEVPLSERELEVLRHVARGYTCKEIGQMLFLSVRTVETYRMRIMHKLGVKNRSELVEYAIRQELI